jgi:hypothetical protein
MFAKIKAFRKEHWVVSMIIGVVAGGLIGFLYYKLVGCRSGTRPLTSNTYISIIWGAVIGFLLAS